MDCNYVEVHAKFTYERSELENLSIPHSITQFLSRRDDNLFQDNNTSLENARPSAARLRIVLS